MISRMMRSLLVLVSVFSLAACSAPVNEEKFSGPIQVDGSSTVFPISEAMGEEFSIENPDVQLTIGVSGTGGGFKRFTVGETDISNASRPIKTAEAEIATTNGVTYTELKVAIDGLTVVIHPENTWATSLTVDQLKMIWKEGGAMLWSDVDPTWPAEGIKLYSPGTDSGTYDYFKEVIATGDIKMRTDFIPSEDDNVLVAGVIGDKYALAYFGYAYYVETKDKLKAVKINGIEPNDTTIGNGTYSPLSRPIFIYVNNKSFMEKPQVAAFARFTIENARDIVPSTGYTALSEADYAKEMAKLDAIK